MSPGTTAADRPSRARWALGGGALLLALLVNYWTGTHVDRIGPSLVPAHDLLFEHLPLRAFPLVHSWGFMGFLVVFSAGMRCTSRGRACLSSSGRTR